jgi:GAF domain-containing protein
MTKRGQAKRKGSATRKPASTPLDLKKENAGLRRKLAQAHAQQKATADVLKAISRSTFDLQVVLNTLVESAAHLCGADMAFISRREGEGYRFGANFGYSPEYAKFLETQTMSPGRGTITGRAVYERRAVQIADVTVDPEYAMPETYKLGRARTVLSVPLLRENEPIGTINLARRRVEAFTEKQIGLATTFADQAVIAIENVRLFEAEQARTRELSESLEQQTATSEVLRVISSSPGELEPVFQKMLENAVRVCNAKYGSMLLHEKGAFRHVALHNMPPGFAELIRREPIIHLPPDAGLSRVAQTKQPVHIADIREEPAYVRGVQSIRNLSDVGGARTRLIVPMLQEGELIGVISIFSDEVRPFTDKQIELVSNFAKQAVIAIENTRLLNELRESLEQQTATSEVLQVISSSPGELAPVFETILEHATRICEAKFGNLLLYDGGAFRNVAFHNTASEFADQTRDDPIVPPPDAPLGRLIRTKQPVHIADLQTESAYESRFPSIVAMVERAGARSLILVPMLKDDQLVGAIGIYRQDVRPFADKQIELVSNFAKQAVIAIENTRLLNELRESLDRQTATSEVLEAISKSQGN